MQQAGGDAAGCNTLPLLARDRLEVGGLPLCHGVLTSVSFESHASAYLSQDTEYSPSQSTHWPPHQGQMPGAWAFCTSTCPAPLFLLSIAFISTSSLNRPICLPLLLPIALQRKSGRSLAGSRLRVLRGWGTMHSVGRKGDCTLPTAKFEESSVALAPLLSTQICLGERRGNLYHCFIPSTGAVLNTHAPASLPARKDFLSVLSRA